MQETKTKQTGDGLESIRKFISPLLILGIGWLLSDKMNSISDQLKVIGVLQVSYAQIRAELDGTKKDVLRIESRQDKTDNDKLYSEAEKNINRKIK